MLSVTTLLVLIALIITMMNGLVVPPRQPPQLWIAVFFLCLALLVGVIVR